MTKPKRQIIAERLYFEDNVNYTQWVKDCRSWDRKIKRLDDEKLIYIRELIGHELDLRCQKYMAESLEV